MPVEGTWLGNEDQGGDEPMDADVSEGEEEDDDIIEGCCYFLEIGIKGLVQRFGYVPNTNEYTTLSRIFIESLHTPLWPSSQANQESVSSDAPLSHGSS